MKKPAFIYGLDLFLFPAFNTQMRRVVQPLHGALAPAVHAQHGQAARVDLEVGARIDAQAQPPGYLYVDHRSMRDQHGNTRLVD